MPELATQEMPSAVTPQLNGLPPTIPPSPPRHRWIPWAIAIGAIVVCSAAVAVIILTNQDNNRSSARRAQSPPLASTSPS
jgi:hypothetical protein